MPRSTKQAGLQEFNRHEPTTSQSPSHKKEGFTTSPYLTKRGQLSPSETFISGRGKGTIPLPSGDSVYAKAKKAEYVERNLYKAEALYRRAISNGERVASAAKDLAGVLHQLGQTQEACRFLRANQHLFDSEPKKFANLLTSL
jgi:hypothetical protein